MFSHEHEVEMTRRYRKDYDLMGWEAEDLLARAGAIAPDALPVLSLQAEIAGMEDGVQAAIDASAQGDIVELADGTVTGEPHDEIEGGYRAISGGVALGNPRTILHYEGGEWSREIPLPDSINLLDQRPALVPYQGAVLALYSSDKRTNNVRDREQNDLFATFLEEEPQAAPPVLSEVRPEGHARAAQHVDGGRGHLFGERVVRGHAAR